MAFEFQARGVKMVDINVEVRPSAKNAGDLASGRTITESLTDRLDDIGDAIMEVAGRLKDRLAGSLEDESRNAWGLDQVTLTFSLDLEAEAGIIVSRLSTTAGFEVELSWSKAVR